MSVYYQGSDGHIKSLGDNELQHFKYIKKIGNRYFYTPEELKAYYADEQKKVRREEAFGGNAKDFERRKERQERDAFRKDVHRDLRKHAADTQILYRDKNDKLRVRDQTKKEKAESVREVDKKFKREARVNRFLDRLEDRASSAEKKTRALRKTVRMAAAGKEKPKTTKSKYSKDEVNSIKAKSWAYGVKREQARKKKKAQQNARNSGAVRAAARR